MDRATQRAKAREAQKRSALDRQKTELESVSLTLSQKKEDLRADDDPRRRVPGW